MLFSFKKSLTYFIKQLCLYFNYLMLKRYKKQLIYLFKIQNSFHIFLKIKSKEQEWNDLLGSITWRLFNVLGLFFLLIFRIDNIKAYYDVFQNMLLSFYPCLIQKLCIEKNVCPLVYLSKFYQYKYIYNL